MNPAHHGFYSGSSPEGEPAPSSGLGGILFGMHGYKMLERNKEQPLLMALYQHGPVATSTAAGNWFEYSRGIFDGCPKDVVVDHAVTLYGFGEQRVHSEPLMPILTSSRGESPKFEAKSNVKMYWLIRNSWGRSWGEEGFIRMLRYGDGKDDAHCGTDTDNAAGTGCKGDAKTVTVCGMCGFLWDSVVPHFHPVTSSDGSKHGVPKSSASTLDLEMSAEGNMKMLRRETAAS